MKKILTLFFIFTISRVNSNCVGFQSESKCLNSNDGCCWITAKFKGNDFKVCTQNYGEGVDNEYTAIYRGRSFTDVNTQCSGRINNCLYLNDEDFTSVTKSKCLSSDQDCCYGETKYEVAGIKEKIAQCYPNEYGTSKALKNTVNSALNVEGLDDFDFSMKMDFAECNDDKKSFYSTCYEQDKESSCLKADSNCCWVQVSSKALENEITAKQCVFNFFRDATLYKDYLKANLDLEELERIGTKYILKCNKHDYALFGGSGNVVKDSKDPTISYDNEVENKKGEAPYSKIASTSGLIRLSFAFSLGLLALTLFF